MVMIMMVMVVAVVMIVMMMVVVVMTVCGVGRVASAGSTHKQSWRNEVGLTGESLIYNKGFELKFTSGNKLLVDRPAVRTRLRQVVDGKL